MGARPRLRGVAVFFGRDLFDVIAFFLRRTTHRVRQVDRLIDVLLDGLATAAQLVDSSTVAGYGADCASRKAVISGADDFSAGWTKSGSVWSRSLPAGTPKITQLFVDGQPMQTARWPDAAAGGRQHALAGAASATGTQVALLAADRTALAGRDVAGATALLRTQPYSRGRFNRRPILRP